MKFTPLARDSRSARGESPSRADGVQSRSDGWKSHWDSARASTVREEDGSSRVEGGILSSAGLRACGVAVELGRKLGRGIQGDIHHAFDIRIFSVERYVEDSFEGVDRCWCGSMAFQCSSSWIIDDIGRNLMIVGKSDRYSLKL